MLVIQKSFHFSEGLTTGVAFNLNPLKKHLDSLCKHPVGEEEGVQEVDGEEPQVGQSLRER